MVETETVIDPEEEKIKEWERKNDEFKKEIDKIKKVLIEKSEEDWRKEFKKDDIFYPGDDAEESKLEDAWEEFVTMQKLGPEFERIKKEYSEKNQLNDLELSKYSAWQICGGIGSTPIYKISPEFDLEGEKSIVKFFREKLKELRRENQK